MSTVSKLDPFVNDICSEYREGVSAINLAKKYGVCTTTMTNFLKKIGIAPNLKRGQNYPEQFSDEAKAIELFNNGVRPSEIILRLGISKSMFYGIAKRNNLNLRGLNNFHPSEESLVKASKSKETRQIMNDTESLVFDLLKQSNLTVIPQYSIGTDNIDFVVKEASVAVEVCCRGTSSKYIKDGYLCKRIKQLGDLGWHVYVLFASDKSEIVKFGINDMLGWIEFKHRNPTVIREYRMIGCPHKILSIGRCDRNELSCITSSADLF